MWYYVGIRRVHVNNKYIQTLVGWAPVVIALSLLGIAICGFIFLATNNTPVAQDEPEIPHLTLLAVTYAEAGRCDAHLGQHEVWNLREANRGVYRGQVPKSFVEHEGDRVDIYTTSDGQRWLMRRTDREPVRAPRAE